MSFHSIPEDMIVDSNAAFSPQFSGGQKPVKGQVADFVNTKYYF